jgi:flagellar biosynthetic protein FlhB
MVAHIGHMFLQIILIAAPMLVVAVAIGLIANLIQVGWLITSEPLQPKFNKLNPVSGIKRLFSMQSIVTLLKSIAKMAVLIIVIYMIIMGEIEHIPELALMPLMQSLMYLGNLVVDMGITIGVLFLFIALADVIYTRMKHTKDLKMTKQEVKDEFKQMEGDPMIKSRIRGKMMEMSMRRMMQEVPKADVVITNPTHYAVAIKYDKDVSDAPRVIAKGVDFAARKIKEKAKENNIHIVEDKQLARTLYATVEIGQAIPPELYQAVAEILAFVYKLRGVTG